MKRFYWILGVVAALGIGAIGYSVVSSQMAVGVSRPVDFGGLEDRELADAATGIRLGSEDAAITIMEFGDYQCPACAEFAALYKPALIRDLVETGRVSFLFRDYPLVDIHPNAFFAARAARCAGDQDVFWEYHDHLFGAQSRWAPVSDPTSVFVELAGTVGADERVFAECINGSDHAEVVSANLALAQALLLPGTPAIVIQKGAGLTLLPRSDYQSILAAVEELENQGQGVAGG